MSRGMLIVSCLLVILPVCFSFLYVYWFGVNVFFADEWDMARRLRMLNNGTLGLVDLYAHHNEHRYFFSWGFLLLLGSMTDYNTVTAMYFTQGCFLVALVALFFVFRRDVGRTSLAALLLVPVSFLIFSFKQFENMLWGNQITFAFVVMFTALALWLLSFSLGNRVRKFGFSAALISATIATFSAVQGLFVWPAGLLQICVSRMDKRIKWLMVGVWSSLGVVEWIVYFAGYERPDSTPSVFFVLSQPITGIRYFMTLLGSALFWQETMALAGGALLAILILVSLFLVYKAGKLGENSFWIALLFFALLSLVAIAVGRSGFGPEAAFASALASRFTAFSILTVVSLYAMLAMLVRDGGFRVATVAFGVLLGFILLSVPTSYSQGVEVGKTLKAGREQAATVIFTYESQPVRRLSVVGYPPERVRRLTSFLDRRNYSVFSESARKEQESKQE